MELKKALFISQEITPYVAANPISELGRELPQGIAEKKVEVRAFMPKYGVINERRNQLHEVIRLSGLNIVIDDTDHPLIIKVATLLPTRMQVYFIDNDDYFIRSGSKDLETETSPDDNDERIMFFARGVIETVRKLRWAPQLVQCSGWATALAPIYLRKIYAADPILSDTKIVYSIYNDRLPAPLSPKMVDKLILDGFDAKTVSPLTRGPIDAVALGKLAIQFSDAIAIAVPDANPELVNYAKSTGKPLLTYPGPENYVQAFYDFYQSL